MNKSKELSTTTNLVRSILEQNKQARSSDSYLYYKVLQVVGKENGIDINRVSIPNFFLHFKELKFPSYETVGRCRRKLQEHHPELAADSAVEGQRILNEETYRDYARKNVI